MPGTEPARLMSQQGIVCEHTVLRGVLYGLYASNMDSGRDTAIILPCHHASKRQVLEHIGSMSRLLTGHSALNAFPATRSQIFWMAREESINYCLGIGHSFFLTEVYFADGLQRKPGILDILLPGIFRRRKYWNHFQGWRERIAGLMQVGHRPIYKPRCHFGLFGRVGRGILFNYIGKRRDGSLYLIGCLGKEFMLRHLYSPSKRESIRRDPIHFSGQGSQRCHIASIGAKAAIEAIHDTVEPRRDPVSRDHPLAGSFSRWGLGFCRRLSRAHNGARGENQSGQSEEHHRGFHCSRHDVTPTPCSFHRVIHRLFHRFAQEPLCPAPVV